MNSDRDVLYEVKGYYVVKAKHQYQGADQFIVFRPALSGTHAYTDSSYIDIAEAKARCDYLAAQVSS